jgi:alpha-glucuronidase
MELPANEIASATCADNVPAELEPGCADLGDLLQSSSRWRERLHDIVLTLPIFMPFLILYRQFRSLHPPRSMSRQKGRLAVTLASAWLAYFTATSLWRLWAHGCLSVSGVDRARRPSTTRSSARAWSSTSSLWCPNS